MGYRQDQNFRLVVRSGKEPFAEFLHDLFAQIPLDQTCQIEIKMFGKDFRNYERVSKMHEEPLDGIVEINFSALFYRGWKSPTLDAAKKFVKSNKYYSALALLDESNDDALAFGFVPYRKLASSMGWGQE